MTREKHSSMRQMVTTGLMLSSLTLAGFGSAGCDMQTAPEAAGQLTASASAAGQASEVAGDFEKPGARSLIWHPWRR